METFCPNLFMPALSIGQRSAPTYRSRCPGCDRTRARGCGLDGGTVATLLPKGKGFGLVDSDPGAAHTGRDVGAVSNQVVSLMQRRTDNVRPASEQREQDGLGVGRLDGL